MCVQQLRMLWAFALALSITRTSAGPDGHLLEFCGQVLKGLDGVNRQAGREAAQLWQAADSWRKQVDLQRQYPRPVGEMNETTGSDLEQRKKGGSALYAEVLQRGKGR